jgi:hypothetical protein
MQITGQVGQSGPVTSGTPSVPVRQGNSGEVSVSELQGKYYEQALRGNTFFASHAAAQALSLTGTTTYTGLVVYNPTGSGKNLVIKTAVFVPTIVATGVYAVMLFSQPMALTPPALTVGNSQGPLSTYLNSGAASVAKVAASCTLAANPVFLRPLVGFGWITAVAQNAIGIKDDIAGEIIVPPGSAIGFVALTTAITGLAYISWDEVSSLVL